ncbi:hypothetical protein OEZ86_009808 [Tetradesmus obliquus]|uniref:Uncharacterized protein n=1 Tax=Tetradesmus obliquus TaxID=3088 RepID=A0ABY8URB5_TETOB|nr:hypothetical protein OEZ85_001249 [Tetradesmus obliquus]WIA43309.1 hypothetical protein OEZ86_009808 [Tetradesmus obliquus]
MTSPAGACSTAAGMRRHASSFKSSSSFTAAAAGPAAAGMPMFAGNMYPYMGMMGGMFPASSMAAMPFPGMPMMDGYMPAAAAGCTAASNMQTSSMQAMQAMQEGSPVGLSTDMLFGCGPLDSLVC